jgi:hypothetical protein
VCLLICCAVYLRLWFCPNRVRMIRRDWARLRAEWRGEKYTPPPNERIVRVTWL